jgi:hypothetical protein
VKNRVSRHPALHENENKLVDPFYRKAPVEDFKSGFDFSRSSVRNKANPDTGHLRRLAIQVSKIPGGRASREHVRKPICMPVYDRMTEAWTARLAILFSVSDLEKQYL